MKHFPIHIPVKEKPDPNLKEIIDEYYLFKHIKGTTYKYQAKTAYYRNKRRTFPDKIELSLKNKFDPFGTLYELLFNDNSFSFFVPNEFQKFFHTKDEDHCIFISLSKNKILLEIIVIRNLNRFSNLLYQMYVDDDFRTTLRGYKKAL